MANGIPCKKCGFQESDHQISVKGSCGVGLFVPKTRPKTNKHPKPKPKKPSIN